MLQIVVVFSTAVLQIHHLCNIFQMWDVEVHARYARKDGGSLHLQTFNNIEASSHWVWV